MIDFDKIKKLVTSKIRIDLLPIESTSGKCYIVILNSDMVTLDDIKKSLINNSVFKLAINSESKNIKISPAIQSKKLNLNADDTVYFFIIKRYKDRLSDYEMLEISAFHYCTDNNVCTIQKCGKVKTVLSKIVDNLRTLIDYGVALPTTRFNDIGRFILDNYNMFAHIDMDINVSDSILTNKVLDKIVNELIQDENVKNKGWISINKYNKLIKESEYTNIPRLKIRKMLKEEGYTDCDVGRTDKSITIGSESLRVIMFNKDMLLQV